MTVKTHLALQGMLLPCSLLNIAEYESMSSNEPGDFILGIC
jgi:hypothetical protein